MKCAAVLMGLLTVGACMGADIAVPPVPVHKEIALDASTLENYVGHYKASDGIFAIMLKDGQLQAQFTDQSGFPIYASAKDKFFYKVVDAQIDFERDAKGKVIGLVEHQDGTDDRAPRLDGLPGYRLFEVEPGRRMNLDCTGSGSPTVLLESGQGGATSSWDLLQPLLAAHTQVCSYDRAGLGFSDPARRPSTSANIVDDLHRLLAAASIKPPYVLVGHSSGGVHVRLYAATWPSEVVGMVLVDPSSEYQYESARKRDPAHPTPEQWHAKLAEGFKWALKHQCIAADEASTLAVGSELYKKCVDAGLDFGILPAAILSAQLSEDETFEESQNQLASAKRSLGDMPLIVLTEGVRPPSKKPLSPEKEAARVASDEHWIALNKDIAALSTRGVQHVIPGVGHYIQNEQPQTVADAVLQVIRQASADPH